MCNQLRRLSLWWRSGICALAFVMSAPLQAHAQLIDLDPVFDAINSVRARVDSAIAQAQLARQAAEEIRTQVRSGVTQLTPEIQEFIQNAVEEGRTILTEEAQGLETFAPGGQCAATCTAFRLRLVELLTASVDLTGAVLTATDAPAQPDLSRLVALAQAAPARTLFPIYRLFESVLASELPNRLRDIVPETTFALGLVIQTSQDACSVVLTHTDRIQAWSSNAMKVGVVVTVIGKLFNALGATEIEASAGAMGFAGGTIKSNKKKQAGEFFTGLGTIIDKAATFGSNKIRECLLRAFQAETRATLQAITNTLAGLNLDLSNLDAPVSSRASQTSVNAVQTAVQAVAQDVTTLLGKSERGSLTTRLQIEQHLARKETLSVLYLPESLGGLLEVVRDVVEDSLGQHQAAGSPVDNSAWEFLSRGDAAKAQFDYRGAYGWYQQAYHLVVSGAPGR